MASLIMAPFESEDAKAMLAEKSKIYCEGKARSALIFTGQGSKLCGRRSR
jgi:hypothetical protein